MYMPVDHSGPWSFILDVTKDKLIVQNTSYFNTLKFPYILHTHTHISENITDLTGKYSKYVKSTLKIRGKQILSLCWDNCHHETLPYRSGKFPSIQEFCSLQD